MQNYEEVIDYLYAQPSSRTINNPTQSLDSLLYLCKWQHNPQNSFKTIHIAGTNGKSSVSHILASILIEAGYTMGLQTSPHLIDFRERIKINNNYIDKTFIVAMVQLLIKHNMIKIVKPSFFVISLWIAFMYFREYKVDFAIIEAGIGGKYDASNIIYPLISIITQISFDHQNMLGNTLESIAHEKAGIIKPYTPIIVSKKHSSYTSTIEKKAQMMQAPLTWADKTLQITQSYNHKDSTYSIKDKNNTSFSCYLSGTYQAQNIATALVSITTLCNTYNICIQEKHIINGIQHVHINAPLRGRWECVYNNPLVIIDGAHNVSGIALAIEKITAIASQEKKALTIIFGMKKSKNIQECLSLLPQHASYKFCSIQSYDSFSGEEIQQLSHVYKLQGTAYTDIKHATINALQNINHVVLITGSLLLAGESLMFFDASRNIFSFCNN